MRTPAWFDFALAGELLCLLLAAPPLYFPNWFPTWAPWLACAVLIVGWVWRRRMLGVWRVGTPADWPLFFLFLVMLPVAVWAAPEPLRLEYSIQRAWILIWNFALFWVVVVHSGRSARMRTLFAAGFISAGVLIAVAGLFGTQWVDKFPGLAPLLSLLPHFLVGRFLGAEEGFSPNQLAGSLLYVIPFALALSVEALRTQRWWALAGSGIALAVMGLIFLLAQSRAGLAGLAVSLAVLVLGPWRWGRWLLIGIAAVALVAFLTMPLGELLLRADDATRTTTIEGGVNIAGRFEIRERALYGIRDFPFTGMGLGTFRQIVPLLYPLLLIPPTYDIAHAHNFFLQTALDFGIPGLVALLAIYVVALIQCGWLYRNGWVFGMAQYWAIGLTAALIGQAVYSLADAVAMGSKTNVIFWWMLAIVFGVTAQRVDRKRSTSESAGVSANAMVPH